MGKAITTAWVKRNWQVTIPKRIRKSLGIEEGDQVTIVIYYPATDPIPNQVLPPVPA